MTAASEGHVASAQLLLDHGNELLTIQRQQANPGFLLLFVTALHIMHLLFDLFRFEVEGINMLSIESISHLFSISS